MLVLRLDFFLSKHFKPFWVGFWRAYFDLGVQNFPFSKILRNFDTVILQTQKHTYLKVFPNGGRGNPPFAENLLFATPNQKKCLFLGRFSQQIFTPFNKAFMYTLLLFLALQKGKMVKFIPRLIPTPLKKYPNTTKNFQSPFHHVKENSMSARIKVNF